jgi:hypothetical protein
LFGRHCVADFLLQTPSGSISGLPTSGNGRVARRGCGGSGGYNRRPFSHPQDRIMEAERINLIAANLAGLARRAEELRGYL